MTLTEQVIQAVADGSLVTLADLAVSLEVSQPAIYRVLADLVARRQVLIITKPDSLDTYFTTYTEEAAQLLATAFQCVSTRRHGGVKQ